eukprot:Gb_03083 [translate_table: standard]
MQKIGNTSNNVAEYEAMIQGMELAKNLDLKKILVLGDSRLVNSFESTTLLYTLRRFNTLDDHLANKGVHLNVGWQSSLILRNDDMKRGCLPHDGSILSSVGERGSISSGPAREALTRLSRICAKAPYQDMHPKEEDTGSSSYSGKRNVHYLAKEIAENTNARKESIELAINHMKENHSHFNETLHTLMTASLHAMHTMIHTQAWSQAKNFEQEVKGQREAVWSPKSQEATPLIYFGHSIVLSSIPFLCIHYGVEFAKAVIDAKHLGLHEDATGSLDANTINP